MYFDNYHHQYNSLCFCGIVICLIKELVINYNDTKCVSIQCGVFNGNGNLVNGDYK